MKNDFHHSEVRTRILNRIDLHPQQDCALPAMSPSELLEAIGMEDPTDSQCQECEAILQELLGDPRRIARQDKWLIALGDDEWITDRDECHDPDAE